MTNPAPGLIRSGGGTITLNAPGLSEVGNTVTVRTTLVHNRSVGDQVTIAGANNAGYNQPTPVTITAVPTPRSFEFTNAVAGLPNAGAGTVTYTSPFMLSYGGANSVLIGSGGLQYNDANLTTAINAHRRLPGHRNGDGRRDTGFTVTFTGASAGVDVSPLSFTGLSCGGCFGSIEETNHGGAFDSFTINYDGNVSAPIVNGTNYSAAGILAAVTPILPAGVTVTVAGFAGGNRSTTTGFQLTFGGTAALTNVPVKFARSGLHAGRVGLGERVRQGRPGRQQGDHVAHGQRDSGRHRPRPVPDPAADAVLADRLRHRRGQRSAALQLGAERPRRHCGHLAPQQRRRRTARSSPCSRSRRPCRRRTRSSTTRPARTT